MKTSISQIHNFLVIKDVYSLKVVAELGGREKQTKKIVTHISVNEIFFFFSTKTLKPVYFIKYQNKTKNIRLKNVSLLKYFLPADLV